MQAVRNHIQVVARCDRSPPALAHDCHDPAARARNGDYSASQRIIQARYDTYYEYAAEGLQDHIKTIFNQIKTLLIANKSSFVPKQNPSFANDEYH